MWRIEFVDANTAMGGKAEVICLLAVWMWWFNLANSLRVVLIIVTFFKFSELEAISLGKQQDNIMRKRKEKLLYPTVTKYLVYRISLVKFKVLTLEVSKLSI